MLDTVRAVGVRGRAPRCAGWIAPPFRPGFAGRRCPLTNQERQGDGGVPANFGAGEFLRAVGFGEILSSQRGLLGDVECGRPGFAGCLQTVPTYSKAARTG